MCVVIVDIRLVCRDVQMFNLNTQIVVSYILHLDKLYVRYYGRAAKLLSVDYKFTL